MIRPPQDDIEEMEEEAAANYVNAPARTGKKMAACPGQRSRCFSQSFLPIAVCWLILLVIMGLRIYFTNRILNNILSVSENPITELETERNNLTGPIRNISRAQWSIDEYCPKEQNERRCSPCQKGWRLIRSSCYLFADPSDRKTWEEAREDCRARSSDLVVVHDEDEEDVLRFYNKTRPWIGLRAEGGRWKWIDGSDLTESVSGWLEVQPPTDGRCVISVRVFRWTSESCAVRKPWICQKKSLSV
ncbi:CD209 antigen-like protein C isoform X2 [Etheostoma spectabile]|uniref:CD209 antigen-like protein C isoform X2 n=1 Tax=Etheostoma spectabile TaxID=54343 RepID=UPI0013AF860A|nr:CD209 antigen-like protein C isoform X2 [Etheostoma spectabile]